MPVPMEVREKIEENLRLIESGKESYASVAKRYGTSKSTVFRIHIRKLEAAAKKTKEELKALKHAKKKLQTDFQGLEKKYHRKNEELQKKHKQRKQKLEEEVKRLNQEKTIIKHVFEKSGLSWEEGIKIVKDISDLRGEAGKLENRVSELKTEVSNWQAKANQARSTSLQLNDRLSNLRGVLKTEETEFLRLLDQKISAEKDLYTIRDETKNLGETVRTFKEIIVVHKLQERKTSLQAEVKKLTAQLEELTSNVENLTEQVKRLEAERKRLRLDRDKLRSEREEKIKKAKELAERIIEDAEQARRRVLAEAEEKRKRLLADGEEEKREILGEIEKLQAEEAFLKTAIRMSLKEFRDARKRLEEEEAGRVVGEDAGPVGNLLSRIPNLRSFKKHKKNSC